MTWDDGVVIDLPAEPNPLDELASLFSPLGDWALSAACAERGIDPTIFDAPEKIDLERYSKAQLVGRQKKAVGLCRQCPVRAACGQDAEENPALTGIRGGVLFAGQVGRVKRHDLLALDDAGLLTNPVGYRGRTPDLPQAA